MLTHNPLFFNLYLEPNGILLDEFPWHLKNLIEYQEKVITLYSQKYFLLCNHGWDTSGLKC